jgi:hypothetical protein
MKKKNDEINKVKGPLQNLSALMLSFHILTDYNNIHPVLATINNIITRDCQSALLLEGVPVETEF